MPALGAGSTGSAAGRMTRLAKLIVIALMVVVALIGLLAGLSFVHGSLELYPTEEQQSKARTVAGSVVLLSCVLEYALWRAFRRLRPAKPV